MTSLAITPEEFAGRRDTLAGQLQARGLTGCVLFDTHHVTYYTGFSFIPTERPIAFAFTSAG